MDTLFSYYVYLNRPSVLLLDLSKSSNSLRRLEVWYCFQNIMLHPTCYFYHLFKNYHGVPFMVRNFQS